ncbi:MAG: hypothetical protein ACOH1Y_01345 [Propionicimonas sp.]
MVSISAPTERPGWTYALWAAVGVLIGFGVVGILTIGIFLLGLALVLAIVGLALPASRTTAALAVIPGLGVLPLVVGLNNLGGPGERCSSTQGSLSCVELLSPWPFAVPGILLVVVGAWLAWRFGRTPTT